MIFLYILWTSEIYPENEYQRKGFMHYMYLYTIKNKLVYFYGTGKIITIV